MKMAGMRRGGAGVLLLWSVLCLGFMSARGLDSGDELLLDMRMPGTKTHTADEYWCLNIELPPEPLNLVAIEPLASQAQVHHMLLYGCMEPANDQEVYECGMQTKGTCKGGASSPMYGWGKDAPGMHFPEGVGILVGPGSSKRMLVLEVHYLEPQPQGDHSGIRLRLSRRGMPQAGGLASLATGFAIPPGLPEFPVHMSSCIDSMMPVHGFAMRVHTHQLGRDVQLSKQWRNGTFSSVFHKDPQEPQGFYPLPQAPLILPRGTRLLGSCIFDSTSREKTTIAGYKHDNEMCNVYLMLYGELPYQTIGSMVQATAPGHLPPQSVLLSPSSDQTVDIGQMGQVAGVEAVEGGRIWVFRRVDRVWDAHSYDPLNRITYKEPIQGDCVLEVERDTGTVLRSWGSGIFYMPHGLTVDHDGFLWLTDTGLHQVFKFSPDGVKLMELGTALQPGHGPQQFCKPTHVAVAVAGDFFVADGYCNSRILQYSPAGELLHEIAPKDKAFQIPHSLLLDECNSLLLVADRLSSRVRAFHLNYKSKKSKGFSKEKDNLSFDTGPYGKPYALTPGPYGSYVVLTWHASGRSHAVQVSWQLPAGYAISMTPQKPEVTASWEVTRSPRHDAPHDIALIPGPASLDSIEERPIQVLVGETNSAGTGGLIRYDFGRWTKTLASVAPTDEDEEPIITVQDKVNLNEAIGTLYLYVAPFGMIFAAVAAYLWRKMGSIEDMMRAEKQAEEQQQLEGQRRDR